MVSVIFVVACVFVILTAMKRINVVLMAVKTTVCHQVRIKYKQLCSTAAALRASRQEYFIKVYCNQWVVL